VIDVAHTADSGRRATLPPYLRIDQATLVIGVMGDKDLEGLASAVSPSPAASSPQADHPALDPKPSRRFSAISASRPSGDGPEAVDRPAPLPARRRVIVLGSVALAGEARAHLLGLG
jgi:folylpolyglutamate synthase/dihydropteroate synthase